jgi:F-type H+-transporting ATPase subunit b
MEILHAFGIEWKLLVIQVLNFSIVLFVLWRYLYRPVFRMLDVRGSKIAKGVEDSERAAEALASAETERSAMLAAAREESGKLAEELHKQAIASQHATIRETQERSAALLAEARKHAEDERAHMLRESEREVAKMAILAAEKILRAKEVAQG